MLAVEAFTLSQKHKNQGAQSLASLSNIYHFIRLCALSGITEVSFKQNEYSKYHIARLEQNGFYILEKKDIYTVYWDEEHVKK